jgi:Do/DeqQ family serine protease
MNRLLQIRRSTAILSLLVAGLVGALVFSMSAAHRTPLFVSPTAMAATGTTEPYVKDSFAPVLEHAMPAVVTITTTQKQKVNAGGNGIFDDPFFRQFFGGRMPQAPREQIAHALGSGVIVSPDGYILTNNHVVENATDIKVSMQGRENIPAKLVGTDAPSDVAVVKIDQKNLPTLPVGNSDRARVGDVVLAIGNPLGIGETATMGIISAKGRTLQGQIEQVEDFIQTDAAINQGNSGGALINTRGELIGINTAIVGGNGGNIGIGFAIPANLARNEMDQIIKSGKVVRGFIGIVPNAIAPGQEQAYGLNPGQKGVAISEVSPNSPGAKAGLKVGDVILAVNGTPVEDENSFRLQIAGMAPGTRVALKIMRDGHEMDVPVTLGENREFARKGRSNNGEEGPDQNQGQQSALNGVSVDNLTSDVKQQLQLPANIAGVVVTSIDDGSAASDAGLQEGDIIQRVNHQKVTTVDEFDSAVKAAGSHQILLLVYTPQAHASRFVVVQGK